MTEKSDEYYVSLAKTGNERAFEYIIKKYKGLVVNESKPFFIRGAEREDVLQEGNIGLFKAISTYSEEKGPFAAFAKLSIRAQILTAVESANKKGNTILNQSVSMDGDDRSGEDTRNAIENMSTESENDPESMFIKEEEGETVRKIIKANLTVFEQNVLELILEGYSYEEIAEKLNKSKKSVDNAKQRIRKKAESLKLSLE